MYKRPVHHRGGVATAGRQSAGPCLAGLKVFLHIRDGPGNAAADASAAVKKQCKKLVQQLGASLTLSEHGADMVVFQYGSEALLENLLAQGRTVVQPDYLVACAQAGRRLDTTSYTPTLPDASRKELTNKDIMPTQVQQQQQQSEHSSHSTAASTTTSHTARAALQDKPYLLDSSSEEDDDDESAATRPVSPPSTTEEPRPHAATNGAHGMQLASEDEVRHAILRSAAAHRVCAQDSSSHITCNNQDGSNTNAQQDPFLPRRGAAATDKASKRGRKTHRSAGDDHGEQGETTPRRSRAKARKTRSKAAAQHTAYTQQQQKQQPQPALTMAFTDAVQLRPLTWPDAPSQLLPAHELYIAVDPAAADSHRCSKLANYSLLVDVIEQLGANYVPCEALYGRRRKPTHLIVDAASHGSAGCVLLARALGIRILTPQWLYDAIALGGFVQILPGIHIHPLYESKTSHTELSQATRKAAAAEVEETTTARAELRFLRKGVAEEMLPVGQQWERAEYRPLLADVHLCLAYDTSDEAGSTSSNSRSKKKTSGVAMMDVVEAREQITELVRLLGAMVVRNVSSPTVQVILDLSHAMPDQTSAMDPATCLQAAFALAVQDKDMPACEAEHTTPARGQHKEQGQEETEVPVVCLGWLVRCLLARRRLPYTGFTLAASSPAATAGTPIQGSPHTPMATTALQEVEVNPYAKTRPGPSSAVKEAKNQLDTQQIDAVLREPSSETNDTSSPSSLLPSSASSTCSAD